MTSASQLLTTLQGISESSFTNEEERVRVRDAPFETLRKVQSPWDVVWEHNWVSGATNASVKTLIDAGLFRKWAECGGGPKTCTELAEMTGADEVLIREFYRGVNTAMFSTLPYFLKDTGFNNPTDLNNGNWQYKKPTANNFFQDLAVNPTIAGDFHCAMECHSKYNLTPWTEVYPNKTIVEAAKPGRALVVDVGGSKGSLILQDLPDVVQDVKVDKAISVQQYDFVTPERVKGARVYFMHNVLHDWKDELVVKILENVVGAMEKGYSRLLIHESLISSVKPLARVTVSDIKMMACLSAKERTEGEWTGLVEKAGPKVVKIWRPLHSVKSVIEVELV
ncbi:O-methyltransferase-domain-containing protein [Rhexocercosporidium sp. MPI-PUGE-AT-0058]|nr:O-methyltransferase-domain-containing protein [Rhexocercosporidium sp. MPI-PUGE-AT-0058]